MKSRWLGFPFLILAFAFVASTIWADSGTIKVYSARKEHLIKPIFEKFTKDTGVKVEYLTGKAGSWIKRLEIEGAKANADLLLTVDAGNLWFAAKQGVLQPVTSKVLTQNVPAYARDPQNRWFGLSIRARTIVYNKKNVKPSQLSTYQDLSFPKWKGKLCLRTSKKVYNQSLVAMFIAQWGEKTAEKIVSGWVSNLAKDGIYSSDTKVLKAIAAGQCQVGIVNTYYLGRLVAKDGNFPVALFWPNQVKGAGKGVHINVSGAGVTRHAKNVKGATRLLEWLSGPKAQREFAELNMEYPVKDGTPLSPLVKSWGMFNPSEMNLAQAGELQAQAIRLMTRVGYK